MQRAGVRRTALLFSEVDRGTFALGRLNADFLVVLCTDSTSFTDWALLVSLATSQQTARSGSAGTVVPLGPVTSGF